MLNNVQKEYGLNGQRDGAHWWRNSETRQAKKSRMEMPARSKAESGMRSTSFRRSPWGHSACEECSAVFVCTDHTAFFLPCVRLVPYSCCPVSSGLVADLFTWILRPAGVQVPSCMRWGSNMCIWPPLYVPMYLV